jgi:small-conductance mechanosensitive channel
MILAAASTALAFPMLQPAQVPTGFALVPGLSVETQTNLFLSVLVVLLLFFARRGMLALVVRRVEDSALRYRWAKVSATVAFILAALLLFQIWFTAIRSLGTFLGLVSAGLAIALRDPVADFAGWVFIMWRRPFDLGDRIQIGEFAGDVVDRRIFQFTIMEIGNWVDADQSTGRMLHVPNKLIFSDSLANYTTGFSYICHEIPVLVTFESDWRKAKEILLAIANRQAGDISEDVRRQVREAARRYMISYGHLTPIVYTKVLDSGVRLTMRYTCDPRKRRMTEEKIWEEILVAFAAEPAIEFAYPTQRIFYQAPAADG